MSDVLDEKALEAAADAIVRAGPPKYPEKSNILDRYRQTAEHLARTAITAYLSALPSRELLAEALGALEPFGTWADHYRATTHDHYVPECEIDGPGHSLTITLGDFRRARAAADKLRAAMGGE